MKIKSFCFLFVSLFLLTSSLAQKTSIALIKKEVRTQGTPVRTYLYDMYDRYGVNPSIAWSGNSDNSYDAAYLDNEGDSIKILNFSAQDSLLKEWGVKNIGKTRTLLGFTKIPDDGSYVIGYTKNNDFKDFSYQYWITRIDKEGKEIFNTLIFGDKSSKDVGSKGEPGAASSARIIFNPKTRHICFFLGHKMKWPDDVRHQGSYIGFLDLDGNRIMNKLGNKVLGDDWFCSHDFDQRILVADSLYYTLSHGDAYPRALVFAAWNSYSKGYSSLQFEKNYFTIPGTTGDNTTNTQTGGFVQLPDGSFGIVFATKHGRKRHDVKYVRVDSKGNIKSEVWLTNYSEQDAGFPRIARYGKSNILAAWEVHGNEKKTVFAVLNSAGAVSFRHSPPAFEYLPPTFDFINLPGGSILWMTCDSDRTISVRKIKPKALH